jgi:hypothetical protein
VNPDGGDKWESDAQGNIVRELWDIAVSEISPVTWAAYLAPHVDVRSCPIALRSKLKRSDDDDDECDPESPNYDPDGDCDNDDDEGDDEEDRCTCRCERCIMSSCSGCYNLGCDDSSCLDDDCPVQSTRAAHMDLLLRRMTS